jgi:hypothetical protein
MSRNLAKAILSAAIAPALLSAQQYGNMTGAWRLDVESSSWGNAHKPLLVLMDIEHREPILRYSGSITYTNENTRQFAFDGRIDGQEYAMVRSFGAGRIAIRRLSPNTIRSIFKTDDAQYAEAGTTTISRDGKRLTRRIHVTGPAGETHWTEVYLRR